MKEKLCHSHKFTIHLPRFLNNSQNVVVPGTELMYKLKLTSFGFKSDGSDKSYMPLSFM